MKSSVFIINVICGFSLVRLITKAEVYAKTWSSNFGFVYFIAINPV